MPEPTGDSAATLAHLERLLRRYADSSLALPLSTAFAELAEGEMAGMVAFDEGSDERAVEGISAQIHMKLSILLLDLRLEIGRTRIDGARWLEDLDPSDFGGSA